MFYSVDIHINFQMHTTKLQNDFSEFHLVFEQHIAVLKVQSYNNPVLGVERPILQIDNLPVNASQIIPNFSFHPIFHFVIIIFFQLGSVKLT